MERTSQETSHTYTALIGSVSIHTHDAFYKKWGVRSTNAAATSAQHRSNPSASSTSFESADTACCENSMSWISSPCDDPNPVRSTLHTHLKEVREGRRWGEGA